MFLIIFLFIIICIFYFLILFNKRVMPIAAAISEKYAATKINSAINTACEEIVSDMQINQQDFFITDKSEEKNLISINTLMINEFCSRLSVKISDELNNLSDDEIILPLGVLTGIDMFASSGPKYKITLKPMGSSLVDYETEFNSAGINQINFQIYLNVESEVSIVNPLYKKNVIIKRKLMLVNTVFNGEVPSTYMTLPNISSSESKTSDSLKNYGVVSPSTDFK